MKISQAVARLEQLKKKHGDIDVCADCPKCGESFVCGIVVIGPETARLSAAVDPHGDSNTGTPGTRETKS